MPNWRSTKLLQRAREIPCQLCGIENGTVVAAHSNQLRDGKGTGIKAHDFRIAALCHSCHARLDQGSDWSKEDRRNVWEQAHRKTVGELFLRGIVVVK